MSAIASAQANHSPMVVLGGRAPAMRWGQGSLQEIDHVPFVRPLAKLAATAESTDGDPGAARRRVRGRARARTAARRSWTSRSTTSSWRQPSPTARARRERRRGAQRGRRGRAIERAGELLRGGRAAGDHGRHRPLLGARRAARCSSSRETLRIPVFLNGLARGCVPADHELFFSRARSQALKEADVALVIGVPMDFRLGFGAAFGEDTEIVVVDARRARAPPSAAGGGRVLRGDRPDARRRSPRRAGARAARRARRWIAELRAAESERRERRAGRAARTIARRCTRCGSTPSSAEMLDRDAIVIGDGGDFVSYAGPRGRQLRARLLARPRARSAAWARARATRWRRSSPTPSARSCCCSATAPSASRGWSSTRSPATA